MDLAAKAEAEEAANSTVSDFCGRVDDDIEYHTKASLYWVGNILSPDECCAECDADPDCGAWTYGKAKDIKGLTGHCYLKVLSPGEEPEKVQRPGVVSGRISKKLEKHGLVAQLLVSEKGQDPRPQENTRSGTCPGRIDVEGHGSMHVVSALWKLPGEHAAPVDVPEDGWAIIPRLNSRAYLAENCTPGVYKNSDYAALKLLGGSLRYTVDLSRAGCGCNAQLHLVPMHWSHEESGCEDYFCAHGWSRCGATCADIGVQDSNKYAWSSQLHTHDDRGGASAGYGGGDTWVGRRSWSESQYGPGARCIDTTWPFDVEVSFLEGSDGSLEAMEVTLSQDLHPCPLKLRIDSYTYNGRDALIEMARVLRAGVTPTIRYWSSAELKWMDGAGPDGQGPCVKDAPEACPESVRFYNFAVKQKGEKEADPKKNSPMEEALENVHEEVAKEHLREKDEEASKLEAEEAEKDRVEDPYDDHEMYRIINFSVSGEDNVIQVGGTGVKEYDEKIAGNKEWEVIAEQVSVIGSMDSSAAPVIGEKRRGEVIVGKKSQGFIRLTNEDGYVSTEGLKERDVTYAKIIQGTCADAGMFPIMDATPCLAAAIALGFFDTSVRVYDGDKVVRPEGCYLKDGKVWLSTNPSQMGNGATGVREPLCASLGYMTSTSTMTTTTMSTTTTSTTITSTSSSTWGWPSLFCIEVTRATGYEFPLVQEQMKVGASIFSCDEYAVFSDGGKPRVVGVMPNGRELTTMVIPKIEEAIGNMAAGATTNSWLNTKTFLQVWDILNKDGRYAKHDWSVKVDPDAVFFADRLRGHLKSHTYEGAKFFVMNCNRWGPALFGSIEVFSKAAVGTYLWGQQKCRETLPWHGWGEDYFMSHCMDMLGVGRIYDFSLLSDKRCIYHPCGDSSRVAFHDYKDAKLDGTWFKCYHESLHGGR